MKFNQTKLHGVFEIHVEPKADERGFFARTWCQNEFKENGLDPRLVQCSISFNSRKGTLRGMHFQEPPCMEAKIVRCTHGAIYDVAVDLRPQSPTFKSGLRRSLPQTTVVYFISREGAHTAFSRLRIKQKFSTRCRSFTTRSRSAGCAGMIRPSRLLGRLKLK